MESVAATLARGAAVKGWRVTVLCFADQVVASGVDHGVEVLRVPRMITLASQPLSLRYITEALKIGRSADILHVHTPNMLAALASLMLGPTPRVVVHWHSDVIGKGLLAALLRPLERALLRRADRIICTSPVYASSSPAVAPFRQKVTVVPIGAPDIDKARAE